MRKGGGSYSVRTGKGTKVFKKQRKAATEVRRAYNENNE